MKMNLEPYELDQIYIGECSQLMADLLPDNCIDLTVTSPPYDRVDYDDAGNLITYPAGGLRTYNGYTWDFATIAGQLWRVTKPGGVVVWVVGDATVNGSETGTSFRQALHFMGLGFNLHDTMIYQTDKPPMNDNRYQACFEFMIVLSKGKLKTFNPITEQSKHAGKVISASSRYRETSGQKGRFDIGATKDRKIKNSIWYYPTNSTTSCPDHPAPFPEALARDHIISWSNPGDLVLDPMAGSGTTLKMAKELGRHWLGFDISPEYVELAQKRVDGARVPLFVDIPQEITEKPEQPPLF